jgi:hypothetical protein
MMSALKVLSLVTVCCVGCTETPESLLRDNRSSAEPTHPAAAKDAPASSISVSGHVSSMGSGTVAQGLGGSKLVDVASTVDVLALGANGALTPVTTAPVKPGGTFTAALPAGSSPTGIFILRVKDVVGSVVGSGLVNGLPAFVKGFFIDATVDTATSFKAEILVTLAKRGVPGVQNYLNVIDAYVDAQLTNSIVVSSVLTNDFNTLVGTTADAVVAAEEVIVDALKKAGIPLDLSALEKAQAAVVSGVQGLATSSTGSLVTASKNLVAALEAASAKAAVPIDQAIFNAVVNGGAMFASTFKAGVPTTMTGGGGAPALGFAVSKAIFSLETALTTAAVTSGFSGVAPAVLDAATKGCAAFEAAVASASTVAELQAAKAEFTKVLVGGGSGGGSANDCCCLKLLASVFGDLSNVYDGIYAALAPLAQTLADAFATLDKNEIGDALATFDAAAKAQLTPKLTSVASPTDAAAIAKALSYVQKQVVK